MKLMTVEFDLMNNLDKVLKKINIINHTHTHTTTSQLDFIVLSLTLVSQFEYGVIT